MIRHRQTLKTFNSGLESGMRANVKDYRLSQNDMKNVYAATMNLLLQNAELVEENRMLKEQIVETPAQPEVISGGTFLEGN